MSAATATVAVDKETAAADRRAKMYARRNYFDFSSEISRPIAKRRELPIGRGGADVTMRRYLVVNPEKVEALKESRKDDSFPNPHNFGSYFLTIEALKTLGLNRWHELKEVMSTFRKLASVAETKDEAGNTFWERFRDKPSRSDKGLDVEGRFLQNINVLQRISGKNPYGLKINQVGQEILGGNGACIDLDRKDDKSPIMVRLNTKPTTFRTFPTRNGETFNVALPMNGLRVRPRALPENEIVVLPKKKKNRNKPVVGEPVEAMETHSEIETVVETEVAETVGV